jgi:hypothetical protein
MDTNRYESARKRPPGRNPVVLGALATAWIYWVGVAFAVALLAGALAWLILQPARAATNMAPEREPAAAVSTQPAARTRE